MYNSWAACQVEGAYIYLDCQGNRICLSIPAGDVPKGSILLGSSPGRGFQYVEPQAAVSLNNELAAARGEMYAAEEEVLWKVSGAVMEVVDSLQISLDMVSSASAIMTPLFTIRLHGNQVRSRSSRWLLDLCSLPLKS